MRVGRILTALSFAVAMSGLGWAMPWKIQPGFGVGPITLSADPRVADGSLVREDTMKSGGQPIWIKYKEGLELHMERSKVLQIIVHNATMSTKQGPVELEGEGGIKVGMTVAQMEQVLGRNYQARDLKGTAKTQPTETYYAYTSKGIGCIARQGRVFQIAIWPKK